ncbi:DUF2252 domain-containing protein [Cupriavidus basilensis]
MKTSQLSNVTDATPKESTADVSGTPFRSRKERRALGKSLREKCPRHLHGMWKPAADRAEPVHLVQQADEGRLPELLALRHGRMVQSPFTFYRGAALNMANDLTSLPTPGIHVQCCGDAHLMNFGGFATAERNIIFAINDLDETLPAPWDWDLKRLAASFVIASRDNGLGDSIAKDAVLACVRSYRENMATFSEMKSLDLWYHAIEAEGLIASIADPALRRRVIRRVEKERVHSLAEELFPKLASGTGDSAIIKDERPTIFHPQGQKPGTLESAVKKAINRYRESLTPAQRVLIDRYRIVDEAIKVVGVGSVGTRCWVVLLMDGAGDPLFLQVKEARASVLEAYAGKSVYRHHGQRVVNGYRLMQPASDMFLGWTKGELGYDYYLRQLRDIKVKPVVETFGKVEMLGFADWCGQSLALSHARSGDPSLITGYLGKSDAFDKAIATFSLLYADQNEADHARFKEAIRSGTIKVEFDPPE